MSPVLPSREKIAIVGIGCRFPGGASDHRTYWSNLLAGKDCITDTPPSRYDAASLRSRDGAKPGRLVGGRGGYIDGFDEFDPAFFGISPREAEHMDPQQRKLLEVAWEALEDGGQRPAALAGRDIGVFVGAFTLDYKTLQFCDLSFENLTAHTATGSMMTILSNRISYCFDFRGPSMSIDTACSSSLVAVHLACDSLRRGESSLALAGGSLLHMAPQYTIAETKGGFLSPEGRSRTFDAAANGYVRAEGVALVALKRLSDALRDNDPIYGVVAGSGVNQDGRTNGITVPNPDAQVELISRVCAAAGIVPGELQYMEAHGTSTPTGDPIEANALARALRIGRRPGSSCYVGSVKTNIGHTESAAGIAGLIKTTLAVRNRVIPPHINLRAINPKIDADLPYDIPTQVTAWPEHDGPARAAVNSFGFGGTNAHVVLEEAPSRPGDADAVADSRPGLTLLPVSARTPSALADRVAGLREELAGLHGTSPQASDLGYTLATRRDHLEHRLCVVSADPADLDEALAAFHRGERHPRVLVNQARDASQGMAWVFTGMGPQWWAMGRQLYAEDPVYSAAVDCCDRAIRAVAGWGLLEELSRDEASSRMSETWLAQPANFAVQVGLAATWRARGLRPAAIVGHSTGEVAAFYEAGVYTFEEAVRIVVHRSRLQQQLVDRGGMLAAGLSQAEAKRRIARFAGRLSVAAVNSPTSVTIAGDVDALEEIEDEFAGEQVFVRRLAVRVPYHSEAMAEIKDELLASLADLDPRPPAVPLYLTGLDAVADEQPLDAQYWWHNVRDTVRFRQAADRMVKDGYRVFLEIGPHPVLAHSIAECAAERGADVATVPSLRRGDDESLRIATSLAALHTVGADVDWDRIHPSGQVVPLPRYPWARERYWIEPAGMEQIRLGRTDHPLLGHRVTTGDPTWQVGLDTERLPYLADHRIQGTVVVPAAAYLEMAAQAARTLTGGAATSLWDISLRKALFLPDAVATPVQVSISTEDARFRVSSVPRDGSDVAVHASGVIRAGRTATRGAPLDVDAVQGRAAHHLVHEDCYAALAEHGYEYGRTFRTIDEVWVGPKEALARIRPAEDVDAAGHHVHPTLLDACFQALLTPLVVDAGSPADSGVRLPLAIDEVALSPIGDQPIWAHAVVTRRDQDEVVGDIALYTESGQPLGRVCGFRAGNVEQAGGGVGVGTIDGWLSELSWVEQPALGSQEPPADRPAPAAAGQWLLFADASGVAAAIAGQVEEAGGRCHLVRPGERYQHDPHQRASTIVPGRAEDIRRLLADLQASVCAGPLHVMHLWNLELGSVDDLTTATAGDATSLGSYSVVALAQALVDDTLDARLHVVTRGVHRITMTDCPEPLGAPAWGVGRVLWQQELTTRRGVLADLQALGPDDPSSRPEEAAWLVDHADRDDVEELALRDGRTYVSRLLPVAGLTRPLPLRLRPDGCYLVTGGFGALGQVLCRTLVRRGARRLLLLGRTPIPERSSWGTIPDGDRASGHVRFLQEMESMGAEVTPVQLDVTDEAALVEWLADRRSQALPPIRGVFHLAGRVADRLLPDMDRETFDTASAPKMVGAYLLHRHLSDEPLDHFVMFASVASLLTTSGQTNYAAGNAFLDALAHRRKALGLPGISVDWGPWAIGMIRDLGLVDHYRTGRGWSSLSAEAGMAVLERVLDQDVAQLLVATIVDWPTFMSWYASPPALVTHLTPRIDTAAAESSDFAEEFRAADDQARQELVRLRFTTLVAGILRVTPERVEPGLTLTKLGLDSLLAMELRARVLTEMGVAVPVVALLGSATTGQLVSQIRDLVAEAIGDDEVVATQVERYTDESRHPLTENQKALWFLKQLDPDGFAYNVGGAVEVRVELNPELMLAAARVLLARHPMLRANFVVDDGQPLQVISPEAREDLAVVDLSGRSRDEVLQAIVEEHRKPYDLERDPLVRFRLFRQARDHWVVMKAAHHIVSDATSTFRFIEELMALYEGLRDGVDVELPPLTATYLDFLNWQRQLLAGSSAPRLLEYWRSHLPAQVPDLALPTDRPRPAVLTHHGASEYFLLTEQLTQRVASAAHEHGVTPYMVLLAAFSLLLHRYSGQDDVIVGSPASGRTQEEFSSVYGYFVNPLPLRVDLSGEPTVSQLLDRVRAAVLGGLDHQDYPFVLLVEKLGLAHDPSRSAVFQAMFILLKHNVRMDRDGYRMAYVDLPEEEGQFDLTLLSYEAADDGLIHCAMKYNTDLFLAETIRRMSGHFTHLLDALTSTPASTPIADLEMLDAQQRRELVHEWSGAAQTVTSDVLVPQLIARAAAKTPEAVAVVVPSESGASARMTYAELDRRATAVARGLRVAGAGAGDVVGVCLPKSADLVVSLLGVLKAGAAYLPLDPDYPAERLAFMVQQAGARLLVVAEDRPEGLVTVPCTPAVPVTTLEESGQEPTPAVRTSGDDPVYVIFTSGSAGRPKAVEVSHASLASAFHAWEMAYQLRDDVRVHLQMASPSFDVFTGDLVRALCSGGTLVLVGREILVNPARLQTVIREERVDCGEFVPAVVRTLLAHADQAGSALASMRLVVVGSDAWKVSEYEHLREVCGPGTRVVNSYGLTEATIDSAFFEGPVDGLDRSQMVPIGRPLANSRLLILDANGQPVPAGVAGELCIAGPGLATGYVGDPEQTAERFVTLPLDGEQLRIYRSGDLARWDSGGRVHLLGRADGQVKVRGHRIEVGEIEARLVEWPGVDQAVVTVRADGRGEDVLSAYCVAAAPLDWRAIRRHLAAYLPTFMIPSSFAQVQRLALTANGKVDVASLPEPRVDQDEPGEPPVTLFEMRTAEHWRDLLGVERIGLQHDFFELGGTSIRLMELVYRLEREFGIQVLVSELFKLTTLRGMAKTVEDVVLGRTSTAAPYLVLNPDAGDAAFCFPPAGGHGLVYRDFAARLDRKVVAFTYLGGDDLIERYADHVDAVQPTGSCVLLGYSLGGNIAFDVAQELERRGRQVSDVLILDSYRITEPAELGEEHLSEFERELRGHLRKHTNSEEIARETIRRGKEYVRFCHRRMSGGTVDARVTVIAEQGSASGYAAGIAGTWHGSSATRTLVLTGSGRHADMLDPDHVAANARLVRDALTMGVVTDAA